MPGRESVESLRVALHVDSDTQPRWVGDLINDLDASPTLQLAHINVDGSPSRQAAGVVERAYRRFDRHLFRTGTDPMDDVDISEAASSRSMLVPVDLVIDLRADASAPMRVPVLGAERWTAIRGVPTGGRTWAARDVLDGRLTTTTGWVATDPGLPTHPPRVVAQSVSTADPTSAIRNERTVAIRSRRSLVRALSRASVDRHVEAGPAGLGLPVAPAISEPPPAPGNARMLWDLARLAIRVAVRRVHGLLVAEQWILAVQKGDDHGMAPTLEFGTATEIVPPDDRFWADPFPVEVDGRWHIFIEEYPFATRQGHLAVLSDAGGSWTAPIAILDRSVHRSYPFVFRHGTDWFLVPESSALGRVELYRSLDFPTAWTLDRVLLDLPGVDPTLVEIEGLWWMFMGIIGDLGAHNEELHLFNAESPFGPWQPHPMNPVRSDIRGARPAGRPYSVDGVWYRPGQDGVGGYGSGVIIHRITRLDREAYDEEAVREIRPAGRRGRVGVHTINAAAGLTVVDFRRRRSLGDRLRSRARR